MRAQGRCGVLGFARRFGTGAAMAVVLLAIPPRPALQAAPQPELGWRFTYSEFADFWFLSVAAVLDPPTGEGYYDPALSRSLDAWLQEQGLRPTPLERHGDRLRRTLSDDPVFEALHFLPAYLRVAPTEESLAELRRVASAEALPLSDTDPGLRALATVLRSPEQRRAFGELLDVLDRQWRVVAPFVEALPRSRTDEIAEAWSALADPLMPYLLDVRISGGLVLVSPAVGIEGRFFAGSEADLGDTRVVVGAGDAHEVTGALLRELCFPAVRRALEAVNATFPDRVSAAAESERAATRCGAFLLDRHAPASLPAYLERFGTADPAAGTATVEARQTLDAAVRRVLAGRTPESSGTRSRR